MRLLIDTATARRFAHISTTTEYNDRRSYYGIKPDDPALALIVCRVESLPGEWQEVRTPDGSKFKLTVKGDIFGAAWAGGAELDDRTFNLLTRKAITCPVGRGPQESA